MNTGHDRTWDVLLDILRHHEKNGRIALAYSGGLDSRFLAHAAHMAGLQPLLLHARGPHIPPAESKYAEAWARQHSLPLHFFDIDPLALPEVAQGSRRRCYACKFLLFSRMKDAAEALTLCDGTHNSDRQGYRPGLQALDELGVHSPLADANLDKDAVRRLARASGLENPEQRARPCLLTRLPYDTAPCPEMLARIALAEERVDRLLRGLISQALANTKAQNCPQVIERMMPDFRLRLVQPDYLELHLAPPSTPYPTAPGHGLEQKEEKAEHASPATGIPEAWVQSLEQELRGTCAPLLVNVVQVTQLSGFFDRTHSINTLQKN